MLKPPLQPSPIQFTQEGNGRLYQSFGTCDLEILVDDWTVIQEAHVLQSLPNDIILGDDFMQQHTLLYHMEEHILFWPDKQEEHFQNELETLPEPPLMGQSCPSPDHRSP
jgi:hypothetical protein